MEPFEHDEFTDSELHDLLLKWNAPEPSAAVRIRMLPKARQPWWKRLLSMSIRVPVPVAALLAVIAAVAGWRFSRPVPPRVIVRTERVQVARPTIQQRPIVVIRRRARPARHRNRDSGVQPVAELRPRIIRSEHEEN